MTPTQLGSVKAGLENHLARLSRGGEQFSWWPEFRLTQARLVKAALGRLAEGTYGCCRQCLRNNWFGAVACRASRHLLHHLSGRCCSLPRVPATDRNCSSSMQSRFRREPFLT